jgi:hypothetical protein
MMQMGQTSGATVNRAAELPEAVVSRLREELPQHAAIQAAYMANVTIGGGEPHFIVGLELAEPMGDEEIQRMMQAAGDAIFSALGPDEYVDQLVLGEEGFSRAIKEFGAVVYRRS